jgi:hypothetical protein
MARKPDGPELADFRKRVHTAWNTRPSTRRRRTKATKTEKTTATDSAVVDLIDWLTLHPAATDQIEAIAGVLGQQVIDELDKSFDVEHRDNRRRDLADHFWCDLLAALAAMLNEVQQRIEEIPNLVTSAIIKARNQHRKRSTISEHTVKLAVHEAWTRIKELPFVAALLPDVEEPLRTIRMLAVMICPAPEDHGEVAKHCLHPLIGECVSDVTKQRLTQVLPEEWLT